MGALPDHPPGVPWPVELGLPAGNLPEKTVGDRMDRAGYPAEAMEAVPVSTLVNDARVNLPECLAPQARAVPPLNLTLPLCPRPVHKHCHLFRPI